ncbi:6,7-dimethyl-8-ribityllumazine synthase [Neorhodopirellula lusitana]|uniref:6,7-dimethyl-8-ribityllumazine synthase n=1 Tax=Neorhodopirellula lusitana TaxID=445327 RepID=A0ABY1PZV8_9BACT|nr:6,7-dimethyl-8-ribityllumazine synthase [Neorhodopirellula lusitana]SMP50102.1 6,7-dimethyl-8-ribityllumazine synthase [Neorhodopirellula lusitana]
MTQSPEAPASIDGTTGPLPDGRIAVIASRYNESICDSMLAAALQSLTDAGVAKHNQWIIRVPGAWELCMAVEQAFQHSNVLAAVTLGCVIRGETTHDEHINRAVSESLMHQSIASGRPVGFGLLTCNTLEQAIQRSGGTVGNKGHEATDAVLEMLRLATKLR